MTGDKWLWSFSREQKRCAVPTMLSGFLRRTRIHQLHNGMLAAAPRNQSPHSSGFYSNAMFSSEKKSPRPAATKTFVTNAAPDESGSDMTVVARRSRPIGSERTVNTAAVSFISAAQRSSLDAPKPLTQLENGLQLVRH